VIYFSYDGNVPWWTWWGVEIHAVDFIQLVFVLIAISCSLPYMCKTKQSHRTFILMGLTLVLVGYVLKRVGGGNLNHTNWHVGMFAGAYCISRARQEAARY
jgi:Na+-transporting NADH:ubiquinone oxidoreductase subunit NqrB